MALSRFDHSTLLHGTWLALGAVEIVLGVECILMSWLKGGPIVSGYLLAGAMMAAGVALMLTAERASKIRAEPRARYVCALTIFLSLLVFLSPLLHVLSHSLVLLLGRAEVSFVYVRSFLLVGLITVVYASAMAWARRRRGAATAEGGVRTSGAARRPAGIERGNGNYHRRF